MARTSLTLVMDQNVSVEYKDGHQGSADGNTTSRRQALQKILKQLNGILSGAKDASHVQTFINDTQPCAAFATVTLASASAADTVTVGTQTITAVAGTPANNEFDQSGTDTEDATSFAAAINGSTTKGVSGVFEASNLAAVITLATCVAGTKIMIANHEFTAVATAANVKSAGDFSIVGTDTADATALKNAINTHPYLSHLVAATSAVGAVTVIQRRGTASIGKLTTHNGSGVSLSVATFTAGAVVGVSCTLEGLYGNQMAFASSNGTRLAVSSFATQALGAGGAANKVLVPLH